MKIGFCSDIHMDMASQEAKKIFYEEVKAAGTELLIIAGDIGTASSEAEAYVREIEDQTGVNVFWVRGNHDFWDSGITRLRELTKHLGYLTKQKVPLQFDSTTLIVGHDGWYDARVGTPFLSIDMTDWRYISEFKKKSKQEIINISRAFAQQAQDHFDKLLMRELPGINRVIIVTHVPPFQEVHVDPNGNPGSNQWAPWFVNHGLGLYLWNLAARHPKVQFDVYCGHTHGAAFFTEENLTVTVAGANYKHPKFWGLI